MAGKLFYQVSLEELVPGEHLLRRGVEAVDFSVARRLTALFSIHTGQPLVDPVVLFKMALLGYVSGRLLRRVHDVGAADGVSARFLGPNTAREAVWLGWRGSRGGQVGQAPVRGHLGHLGRLCV